MIIGFDGSRAFIKDKTGTENYSYQLLKALAKIDTENDYLIYIRPGQEPGKNWPENFKFKLINFPRLWTQVGLAEQTFVDPLDILFIPAHTLPLIRKPGLKTVITVHDLGAEYLPNFHQLKQVLYLKLMTHYQLKSASKIIAVSQATKKDIVKRVGIKSEKIEIVYEGVSEQFVQQQNSVKTDVKNSSLKQFGLEKNKYFLFVGTIQPRKNLERLIKAFNLFSHDPAGASFKLALVGGIGWKSDQIYSLPKELGIESKVSFLGRVSDSDLASLYRNAAALTYPSLFEGFGLPILEAFACGCPVITSNISSMPEVAGDAALLVNPENEKEIFEVMLRIVKDDKLRDSLIDKGSVKLKDFSWEKAAKECVELFKKLNNS